MIIKNVELETVCGITSKLPDNQLCEIAFAGKSNVGKSSIINSLTEKEKMLITLYFGFDGKKYRQKEIAHILGISQSYISRMISNILKKIKSKIKIEDSLEDFAKKFTR